MTTLGDDEDDADNVVVVVVVVVGFYCVDGPCHPHLLLPLCCLVRRRAFGPGDPPGGH